MASSFDLNNDVATEDESDAVSPERTELEVNAEEVDGAEEDAEEVDEEEVDEEEEPLFERMAPEIPLIEISTDLRAEETTFASDDINEATYDAQEEGEEDAEREYLMRHA